MFDRHCAHIQMSVFEGEKNYVHYNGHILCDDASNRFRCRHEIQFRIVHEPILDEQRFDVSCIGKSRRRVGTTPASHCEIVAFIIHTVESRQ